MSNSSHPSRAVQVIASLTSTLELDMLEAVNALVIPVFQKHHAGMDGDASATEEEEEEEEDQPNRLGSRKVLLLCACLQALSTAFPEPLNPEFLATQRRHAESLLEQLLRGASHSSPIVRGKAWDALKNVLDKVWFQKHPRAATAGVHGSAPVLQTALSKRILDRILSPSGAQDSKVSSQ